MPRTRLFRVAAAVLALLTSVSTPGLAYAHARVHAHIALEHGEIADGTEGVGAEHDHVADHHDDDQQRAAGHDSEPAAALAPSVDVPSHGHAHDHPSIAAAAAASRDEARFGGNNAAQSAMPCVSCARLARRRIPRAVIPTNALLARPGPDSGPPPSPRAPPAH